MLLSRAALSPPLLPPLRSARLSLRETERPRAGARAYAAYRGPAATKKRVTIHARACVTKGGKEEYTSKHGCNDSGVLIVVKLSYSSCWGFGGEKETILGVSTCTAFATTRSSPSYSTFGGGVGGWFTFSGRTTYNARINQCLRRENRYTASTVVVPPACFACRNALDAEFLWPCVCSSH